MGVVIITLVMKNKDVMVITQVLESTWVIYSMGVVLITGVWLATRVGKNTGVLGSTSVEITEGIKETALKERLIFIGVQFVISATLVARGINHGLTFMEKLPIN